MRDGWELELLFPSATNTRRGQANVTKAYKRVLRKAGLPSFRLYDLRHTYGSMLAARGAPITYICDQMGHASPEITLKHYLRWIPDDGPSHADALDDATPETVATKVATKVATRTKTEWEVPPQGLHALPGT